MGSPGSPGGATTTKTTQLSTSGYVGLEQEPFCGINKIPLEKKPPEWPHLDTQACLCAIHV